MMDWQLFKEMLSLDSTSGKERETALWLHERLEAPSKELMEVGDGTLNLFLRWGTPQVVFCTHMDTVPPYIPPAIPLHLLDPRIKAADEVPLKKARKTQCAIKGRGSCDAKGQLFAMYMACKELEAAGVTDFGLLLLAGEETGSWGAKAFSKTPFQAPYLVVGEPTENKMVSASKGTKSFDLVFTGQAFHSGYPQYGVSAVDMVNDFYNKLKEKDFGQDPLLGETTWNVGLLHSDNPQNILSPELKCRLYFRTTFVSDQKVQDWMASIGAADTARKRSLKPGITVIPRGGDAPARYFTLPGFRKAPVAFGSDAPHLTGFSQKIICGPGTVRVAHRTDEQILPSELETAVGQYVKICQFLQR